MSEASVNLMINAEELNKADSALNSAMRQGVHQSYVSDTELRQAIMKISTRDAGKLEHFYCAGLEVGIKYGLYIAAMRGVGVNE